MTITSQNIKLRQSERMTDFDDGGGQMSATEIVDGVLDNVFGDRSEADGITGRVSLRKIYTQVNAANTDAYLGAFAFLTDPPADSNVSVCIFDTSSYSDERTDAATYVQNYRIQGVKTQFILYGNHIVDQQTVQVYCRDSTIASPNVGDVLELSIEATGYTPYQQFVKVDQVLSRQTLTFEDGSGIFQRDVLIIQITSPLQYAFPGQEDPQRITGANPPPTKIRYTQAASTSTPYYGISPLTLAASIGDSVIKIDTPYIQVVPSTQSEDSIADVLAGEGKIVMCQSGSANTLSMGTSATISAGGSVTRYLGSPFLPGSLSITYAGATLVDDGSGNIGSSTDATWSGVAEYTTGALTISRTTAASGAMTATATPAGGVQQQTQSLQIPITASNRGIAYVIQIPVPPNPGTVMVDYLALGQWVRLVDNGTGIVSGDPGTGSGPINYATGSLPLTLGAQPDVGSPLIVYWGTNLRARNVSGEITIPTPNVTQQLAHGGNKPGTCSITWTSGGVAKTATVGSDGTLSGDATGRWDFSSGLVAFTPASVPDVGFTYTYSYVDPTKLHTETFTPTAAGGSVTFTLAHAAAAGTVTAQFTTQPPANVGYAARAYAYTYNVHDNGSGAWVGGPPGTNSINYSTGACVLPVEQARNFASPVYTWSDDPFGGKTATVTSWFTDSENYTFTAGSPIVVKYLEAGASVTATTETYSAPPITINLSAGSTGAAVPGSVRFTFRGRTYVDRNGSLYYAVDPTTNAGTLGGQYDYQGNIATLSDYAAGSNTVTINSLLTRYATVGVTSVDFRTHGAPLGLGSFVVRATDFLGNTINATTDVSGNISGVGVTGKIDQDTGGVNLRFGAMVTAAGNESQTWYSAANVVGGQIWKPTIVDPSTIFTGYVVFKSIPLSPQILGLDPVRLPSNGKVLGFSKGIITAVHNTQVTSLTPTAGAVTNLGRPRLSFAEVKDSLGVSIDPTWYTADLNAGTITWANPLNLSAYTMPVNIRHRIEDIYLCADIQITGQLTLQSPVTHNFPVPGSYVSSCLYYGDMQARVTNLFDQQTWTSVFSDVLIGSPATSSYNDVIYPIQVSNDSVTQDRWALDFQSINTVSVIGEIAGNLGNFSILSDIAPINPVSGKPYFTIPYGGWGSGWAAGNVLRFNTISATKPTWLLRCTKQGPIQVPTDQVRFQVYGGGKTS